MKKITLAIAILATTFNMYAQDFPAPYCDIDPMGTTVEEITTVNFSNESIVNEDTTSILVDETLSIALVVPGETLTLTVAGNTVGDFDTDIVAFIDWNRNDILDDDGEVNFIGTITNSTGNDGITVSADITVPDDIEIGFFRIRITKIFQDPDSPAEVDPCAISFNPFGQGVFPGFGQALDFTLEFFQLGFDEFDVANLSVYPIPAQDRLNIDYIDEIKTVEIYNVLGQLVLLNSQSGTNFQLDTAALQTGTYFVKLNTENTQYTVQIVKQ